MARMLLEESLSLRIGSGERRELGMVYADLAAVETKAGNHTEARQLRLKSIAIKQDLRDWRGVGPAYHALGLAAWLQAGCAAAHCYFIAGLPLSVELRDLQFIAFCLEGLARARETLGDPQEAVKLWGSAATLREKTGSPLTVDFRKENEECLARAKASLGEHAFNTAWSEGQIVTMEEVNRCYCTTS